MAITHKFDNAYTITDYTQEINLVPNMWGLISNSGLFRSEPVGTNTITFDKSYSSAAQIVDKPWGERSTFSGNAKSELYTFAIPTFPLDDFVTVGDVWNKRKVGTADQRETIDNVLMAKTEQIRRSYALTQELAKCRAIQGLVYAPSGTIPQTSWYTEFGYTQETLDFKFADAGTDQRENVQRVVAYIQDKFKGAGVIEDIVFYCTPDFFANLIGNAQIESAYTYYSSTQEPLRNDLRKGMYREFVWQGVTFIEYRGKMPDGTEFFPEDVANGGAAWALPKGMDGLVEYYAPAYRLDAIGSNGSESAYMWTYEDRESTHIKIQSESNFLTMNQRPDLVVKCFGNHA